jgi:hypothetical protein
MPLRTKESKLELDRDGVTRSFFQFATHCVANSTTY